MEVRDDVNDVSWIDDDDPEIIVNKNHNLIFNVYIIKQLQ